MIYKLIISPEAFREIELTECFFKIKGVEKSFLNDLNNQFLFLEKAPLSHQIRYKNIRIHRLEIYNYAIHYKVTEGEVMVLHIFNQSQDY
ncbi:type II toxin-antitoxin system RelE/ParE family toxin [Winogradskyella forsetii]|uniref:type II toxin-antitoxin system RelE/ParE family toxin n=1 Tax=Winogradskyella forsetii TaxID=2686077 RepID=UPI0015B7AED9|nr:type II toxin-antitoxin system RelE/ParE family toxin [Winogradskyella forsetii]